MIINGSILYGLQYDHCATQYRTYSRARGKLCSSIVTSKCVLGSQSQAAPHVTDAISEDYPISPIILLPLFYSVPAAHSIRHAV